MKTIDKSKAKLLIFLLKNIGKNHTISEISKEIHMSRVGTWKLLKKVHIEKLILMNPIGTGKTSTYSISLDWKNKLLDRILPLLLAEEALNYQRWLDNFSLIENKVEFLLLYGSILNSPKDANDIDIINLLPPNKNKFIEVERIILKIQKSQAKKIHLINTTEKEFLKELKEKNNAYIDAIKKGVILFGQDRFVSIIKKYETR